MLESPLSQTSEYLACREQVIAAIADLPQGKALSEALIAGRDFLHWIHPDEVAGVTRIQVREGHGLKISMMSRLTRSSMLIWKRWLIPRFVLVYSQMALNPAAMTIAKSAGLGLEWLDSGLCVKTRSPWKLGH